MKTLCAAVVVLSLISGCRPAPLACEQLLRPLDRSPELAGRWNYIAFSTENCLLTTLTQALSSPSVALDIFPKDGSIIEAHHKVKMYGYCANETKNLFILNDKLFDVDGFNAPIGVPDVMLQTGCQDCIVIRESGSDFSNMFALLSRRTSVSAEELQEFEAQVKCLGWSKPQIFNTDHDHVNCQHFSEFTTDEEAAKMAQNVIPKMLLGLGRMGDEILECIKKTFWSLF